MNEQDLMPVEAFEPAMLEDPVFRKLYGALATMYAVSVMRVKGDTDVKRSFECAKQTLTTFVAKTSGWQTRAGYQAKQALRRDTGNGSGRRSGVHEADHEEGQARGAGPGDVEGVGRRGSGLRSGLLAAAVQGSPACPSCGTAGTRFWRVAGVVVCPRCHRKGAR